MKKVINLLILVFVVGVLSLSSSFAFDCSSISNKTDCQSKIYCNWNEEYSECVKKPLVSIESVIDRDHKFNFFGNMSLNMCLPLNLTGVVNGPFVNADVDSGVINLTGDEKYNIKFKYLGGYFGWSDYDGYATRVTSVIKIGDKYYSVGDYNDPIKYNVNGGGIEGEIKNVGNTSFSIISKIWDMKPKYSNWTQIYCSKKNEYNKQGYELGYDKDGRCYYRKILYKDSNYYNNKNYWYKYGIVSGNEDSNNVIVLKNGDSINKILKNYDQTVTLQPGIKKYIEPYVKNNKIVLKNNQFLYLFEFNNITTCSLSKTCDYQDSVILITINPIDESGKEISNLDNDLKNKVKIHFSTDCNNKCYIPMFSLNGGTSFDKNFMTGGMRLGIYYDCNSTTTTTKEDVIKDYCGEIEKKVIEFGGNDKYFYNMVGIDPLSDLFQSKNYVAIFDKPEDNKKFYDTYCVNNNYEKDVKICQNGQTKTIKFDDVYDYLKEGATVGACQNSNIDNTILPFAFDCSKMSNKTDCQSKIYCNWNEEYSECVKKPLVSIESVIDRDHKFNFFGNMSLNMCVPLNLTGVVNGPFVNADVDSGVINLTGDEKYNIKFKYLGGYFGWSDYGGYATRVTSVIKIGDKYYSVGDYNDPIKYNVNGGGIEGEIKNVGNTSFSIISKIWDMKPKYSNWTQIYCSKKNEYNKQGYELGYDKDGKCYYRKILYKDSKYYNDIKYWKEYEIVSGNEDSNNVIVLKNGDSINKILKNYDQTVTLQPGIKKYIEPYVKNNKIVLKNNQFLYLFEFNNITTCSLSKTCDYQDSVILITINPIDESGKEISNLDNDFKDKVKIHFSTDCNNKCYIPMFSLNGGTSFDKNFMTGGMRLGIYYDCNSTTTKEDVIEDYCGEIEKKVIEFGGNDKYFYNMVGIDPLSDLFQSKNYVAIFDKPEDNKKFYDTYCVNNNYEKDVKICQNGQTKTIKFDDVYDYLKEGATVGVCQNGGTTEGTTEGLKLPPYVKIDYKNSEIIFNYAKSYNLHR